MPPHNYKNFHTRLWEDGEPSDSEPKISDRETTLPSIRQFFPYFDDVMGPNTPSDTQQDRQPRTPPSAITPTRPHFSSGSTYITTPEYVISPNPSKRRRTSSIEEPGYHGASQVPRPYAMAYRPLSEPQSPSLEVRPPPVEPWMANSGPSSPYYSEYNALPCTRSPDSIRVHRRTETRRTSNFEPGASENLYMLGHTGGEYMPESSRRSSYDPRNSYTADVGGGRGLLFSDAPPAYHHPSRTQSLSAGSGYHDRTPFHPAQYGHYQETYMRMNDFSTGANGDGKQRKRRGNLPKEITEKLRTWFFGHLSHPYPTEEQKQTLMRETGLQMNQISNWFINARRRQLPALIMSARAETDVMNGKSADDKGLSSSVGKGHDHKGIGIGSKRHRATDLKRGSI